MSVKDVAQVAQGFAVAAAVIAGGVWALYRFLSEREFETAFGIEVSTTSSRLGDRYLLFVDAAITNKGKRKVEAKTDRRADGFIYADSEEKLRHSCSLQVKRVAPAAVQADGYLDWYSGGERLISIEAVPEIDLATEYENPSTKETEFWLEPGETARLGAAIVLSPGDYLLKVTFVGTRENLDYWSSIQHVHLDRSPHFQAGG